MPGHWAQHVTLLVIQIGNQQLDLPLHIMEHVLLERLSGRLQEPLAGM